MYIFVSRFLDLLYCIITLLKELKIESYVKPTIMILVILRLRTPFYVDMKKTEREKLDMESQ